MALTWAMPCRLKSQYPNNLENHHVWNIHKVLAGNVQRTPQGKRHFNSYNTIACHYYLHFVDEEAEAEVN